MLLNSILLLIFLISYNSIKFSYSKLLVSSHFQLKNEWWKVTEKLSSIHQRYIYVSKENTSVFLKKNNENDNYNNIN